MPEHKVAELTQANRLLLGFCFIALVLLGPSFILGYFSGYRSARAGGPQSVPGPTLVASTQSAPPAETMPRQSTRTEQQKPARRVRKKDPAPARADQPAVGQIYLQLVAAPQSQSAVIIDALRNDGLPAVASEVPEKPGLYRVLIGPLHEGDLDKTRAELRSRGFPGDSAIKRTFSQLARPEGER